MDERECSGGHQSTSLMKAARWNQLDLVVTALECTATNLDAVGADGRTALMIACEAGHLEVAKAMANAGAWSRKPLRSTTSRTLFRLS